MTHGPLIPNGLNTAPLRLADLPFRLTWNPCCSRKSERRHLRREGGQGIKIYSAYDLGRDKYPPFVTLPNINTLKGSVSVWLNGLKDFHVKCLFETARKQVRPKRKIGISLQNIPSAQWFLQTKTNDWVVNFRRRSKVSRYNTRDWCGHSLWFS